MTDTPVGKPVAPPLISTADDALEASTMRLVRRRFLPVLVLGFLVAYLDRVNVGFAALTANSDLGLSPTDFALGAGVFFWGYFLFELPSNLVLEKVGARIWVSRILITIGLVSMAMVAIRGPVSFEIVRFLLGAAEAGLFPGVIYFMSLWFPKRYKAQDMALFMMAIPLSGFIGAPVSSWLLALDGALGLRGWQWMYLIESVPAIVIGLMCYRLLSDTPANAPWLSREQQVWLQNRLAQEKVQVQPGVKISKWQLLKDVNLLCYGAIFFGVTAGSYGLSLWLPLILKGLGLTTFETGLMGAVPFAFGCVATIVWGWSSDIRKERVWHTAIASFVSALGLGLCLLTVSPALTVAFLSVSALGLYGVKGPFFALATERLPPSLAAAGIAVITSLAGLAGFVGPYVVGWLKTVSNSYSAGLGFLALLCVVSGLLTLIQASLQGTKQRD
ncbi:MFS transporter [Neorhizobium sp. P12A]|uniref:MFS transporter n=1 Tax=Neorhizobium sp. P12A TaxID=2268027 RepID=UPI0011EDDF26|nr:MFS transporter [Neorhizobium sp. P12A]KAA0697146.1 MFS transporter [Neorhizobium sp. P12A]